MKESEILMIDNIRFNNKNENFYIDNSIMELKKKFLEIKKLGYVKTIRNGSTGIGATFEYLIGKVEDKLEIPDYKGIEIKTRRAYSRSSISLFNATPKNDEFMNLEKLRDKYGYPDKKDKNLKRFAVKISAVSKEKVGLFYRVKLVVDRNIRKIFLCVYDLNDVCIDNSYYWDFSILEEKIMRKLSILALVKAWPNKINEIEYFKYYKMNFYILKQFENFICAIEEGKINVSFKIGNFYEKYRYGEIHAHGVSFVIKEENLDAIYDIYR